MKRWVLATFNPSKLSEISALIPKDVEIISLASIEGATEPVEDGNTLAENALIKARYAHALTGLPALADDTGLIVPALNGAPGVYSARYAGEPSDPTANIQKLLHELSGEMNRSAHFETVIAIVEKDKEPQFLTGRLEGKILQTPTGTGGFGYDPVFMPEGENRSLAEMSKSEKNSISHRGKAIQEFLKYIYTHE